MVHGCVLLSAEGKGMQTWARRAESICWLPRKILKATSVGAECAEKAYVPRRTSAKDPVPRSAPGEGSIS